MQALAKKIQPLTASLKKLPLATVSLSVRMLDKGVEPTNVGVRSVNVDLICLFCDFLQHNDVCLPRNFLTGFNASGIFEDSRVLRPQPLWRTHVQTMSKMTPGRAKWPSKFLNRRNTQVFGPNRYSVVSPNKLIRRPRTALQARA